MNSSVEKPLDSSRSLQLLSEISGEEPLSQRELSRCLGIAGGLDANVRQPLSQERLAFNVCNLPEQ